MIQNINKISIKNPLKENIVNKIFVNTSNEYHTILKTKRKFLQLTSHYMRLTNQKP